MSSLFTLQLRTMFAHHLQCCVAENANMRCRYVSKLELRRGLQRNRQKKIVLKVKPSHSSCSHSPLLNQVWIHVINMKIRPHSSALNKALKAGFVVYILVVKWILFPYYSLIMTLPCPTAIGMITPKTEVCYLLLTRIMHFPQSYRAIGVPTEIKILH